ncbi:MAG: hypothetical protein A3E83_08840 [Gammaproteobacteria bacterium RIFCSPHIGHO2_12_FULL_41_20]|nr:MAG: hypothetical protein A3E83_08840 [Gammaproteobacteria bacterium RIFCSPHIGHO2_12_FULL_41_20]
MKKSLDLQGIYHLQQTGHLQEAESEYLALLGQYPHEVSALHGLAMLYVQLHKLEKAYYYFEEALHYQPQDPILMLHLANVIKAQGLFAQAEQVLQNLIQAHPSYAAAYNNLGTLYFTQEKFSEAVSSYYNAIELQPDYAEVYYNLGLALTKLNQVDDAIIAYEKLIDLMPDHDAAHFQLGCLFMHTNQFSNAIQHFLLVTASCPQLFEAETNLATCYLKQGALNQAKNHYLRALDMTPEDIQILFNLGVINMQQGHTDSAIRHYQQAVKINPDFFEAHNNLGVAFLAKQHIGYALEHFQEALRIRPHDESIRYTVHMLSQDRRLLASPLEYVKTLFDAYADHYEPHLLQALDYQVPTLLYQAVEKVRDITSKKWNILDLGCGTGLSGLVFANVARKLIGVDLSTNMLAVAEKKKIYNELILADITTFLGSKQTDYDLIIAADVLVYIGDLQHIFKAVAQALRNHGLFVFNTEVNSEGDFHMMQSGRFAHNKTYVDELLATNHLNVISYQMAITRLQNNEPVYGHIYVVEKPLLKKEGK